jgi:hypothetical protein
VTWVRARMISDQSRGRTKYNRSRLGIANSHARDAARVGEVGTLVGWQIPSTQITATGRGDYCRTNPDRHGFSRGYYTRAKQVRGFKPAAGYVPRCRRVPERVCMLAAWRCMSPALPGSAALTESTPSAANVFTARTAKSRCRAGLMLMRPEKGAQTGLNRLTISLAAVSQVE